MRKTILYITDTHLDESAPRIHGADALKNWKLAISDIESRQFDMIVFGGDIGEFSAYPNFFKTLSEFANYRVTPGNHDTSHQVRQFFPNAIPTDSGFYSAEEDDFYKMIFLDSSTNKISPEQMSWLEFELSSCQKPILLFVHHPILEVDSIVDKKYSLENRDKVKRVLLNYTKPVIVFCGHLHTEDQAEFKNIKQYITPAVSYQIKKNTNEIESDASYFGYRLIEIDDNKVESNVIILYPDGF